MNWKSPLLGLMMISIALAGCSGGSGGGGGGSDGGGDGVTGVAGGDIAGNQGVEATDDTGIIVGVVVTESIVPIEGVTISIQETGDEAVTDELGQFAFGGLNEGSYIVTATKLGFFEVQKPWNVEAGEDDPDPLQFILAVDEATKPAFDPFVFNGYVECSTQVEVPGVGFVGIAVCSIPNSPGELACAITGTCIGNVTNDQFGVFYPVQRKPTFIQSEMHWEATSEIGKEMELMFSWSCDTNSGFPCDFISEGVSPLVVKLNETLMAPGAGIGQGSADYDINSERNPDLWVRVFADPPDEYGGVVGLTTLQEMQIVTHVFYGFEPVEGWVFSEHGDPELP